MSRISTAKLALVLLLATVLTPSEGWAASRRFSTDDSAARIFTMENPLVAFWSYIVGLWDKAGCGIDPSGLCKTTTNSDAGCEIDPSGCLAPSDTTPKNGCGIDPHGGNCT